MRPRVLTMSAFGPYAATEVVDFRPLDGRDLVLIEGPTGAGKTAILDAMTFALFGVVPGARDLVRAELKSAWADPSAHCEVRLDFTLGERAYRVVRSPAQTRAKKRGGGLTQERPEAKLFALEPGLGTQREVPLCASRVADVDAEVTALLGLSAEQFKQVLLLPQGDFRRFLLATSTEKETLLEQLFGTGVYKDAAAVLHEGQLRLERRAAELQRALDEISAARGVGRPEELGGLVAALRTRLGELGAASDAASREAGAVRLAQARGDERAGLHAERARLLAESAVLAARAGEIEALESAVAAAERAQPLASAFARARQASADRDRRASEAARRLEEHEAAARSLLRALEAAAELPARRADVEQLAAADLVLARLAATEIEVKSAAVRVGRSSEAAARAQAALTAARASADVATLELAAVERSLEAAREAAVRAPALASAATRAAGLAADRRALAARKKDAAKADALARGLVAEIDGLTAGRDEARRIVAALRDARDAELAVELAARLVHGEACPVCGATEHPRPAAGHHRAADRGEARAAEPGDVGVHERGALAGELIAEAEARVDGMTDAITGAERRLATVRAEARAAEVRAAELQVVLGEAAARTAAELDAEERAATQRAADAHRSAADVETLAARRIAQKDVVEARRRAVETADGAWRTAAEETRLAQAKHDDLRASLLREVPEGTVAARRAEVRARRDRATRVVRELEAAEGQARSQAATAEELLAAAGRAAGDARAEAATAEAELLAAAVAAGFASPDEAGRALAAAPDAARGRREIAAFHRARAAAEARLGVLAAELGDEAAPDVAALTAVADEAERRANALAVELGQAQAALGEHERAQRHLAELGAERDAAARELATQGRLARVVTGDNRLRMSLPRYVLASRMDEVAQAASVRLLAMSRGRYLLLRTDTVRHAARGSGLELLVEDRATGQERSVHSLSGGEMFLASLSLAMALADIVQAHAGGVRLESLFIDEGFGSLDDETLDQVMRTLEDLRAGGRLVGIISHVPELRERLTTRLSVQKGARGSTTRLVL